MAVDVDTSAWFLRRDPLYDEVKPYNYKYVNDEEIPPTNVDREEVGIRVHDIRGKTDQFTFDEHGFVIKDIPTRMTYEDYSDPARISDIYLPELETALQEMFPGKKVDLVDYLIRKRHPTFPEATGEVYTYVQPNSVAHVDTTLEDTAKRIRQRHGQLADRLLEGRFVSISVWKPIRGPLEDWPLALCDATSVDATKDLEAQDVIVQDSVIENYQVYHNPEHRWCYISNQTPSEVLIFRQADSTSGCIGIPHCAFYNPLVSPEAPPRESIEVTVYIYED